MELLSTSTRGNHFELCQDGIQEGFTLIELLLVIGLLAMIAGLGLFISMDFYQSYAFRSERSTIVSVLQKARSQSMDNINEKRHGVHFFLDSGNKLTYLLFECAGNCTAYQSSSSDLPVTASYHISLTPNLPFDVMFDQLNGNCIVTTTFDCDPVNKPIVVSENGKVYNIKVNTAGQIDW